MRKVRFNPYMEEISGYSLAETKGQDWFSLFLKSTDNNRIRKLFQEAIRDIRTHGNINTIIAKDGHEIMVEWYDKTLKDHSGNVVGLIAIGHDISAHKTTPTIPFSTSEHVTNTSAHILVMDDYEFVRELSVAALKSFGHKVDSAIDGKETIEKYLSAASSADPFDIIIMDLTIPGGMGGKETIEKLLTINPEVKVIVCSGYSTDPIMANFRNYGFKGRLAKPFEMNAISAEIDRVMAL